MSPTLLRLAGLGAVLGCLGAAELAPSADRGGLPNLAPRTWINVSVAPDDQAVAAQVPRRREVAIGAAAEVDPEHGLGVHVEGVWSPVRAPREPPSARVDELLAGIGAHLERPGETFAWRLAVTAGVRVLTDLKTAELDRAENRLLRGVAYHSEGNPEHPDTVDALLTAHWTSLVRLTDSDPIRDKPVDLVIDARALRVLPSDGHGSAIPDLRLGAELVLPSRTTVSWFGLQWQGSSQPSGDSHALEAVSNDESGWWFASGGALRLGSQGAWLVELGSSLNLASGIAVGSLGVVRTADPPRSADPGTSSLEVVVMRGGNGTSAGIASGDQLQVYDPVEIRTEIRTLIGDRSDPPGAVTADAVRLDALLRAQLPFKPTPLVSIGPEVAIGLGLRRDAVEFIDHTYATANRIEATGDFGLAGRVSTGWGDGIASLGASLGWAWWQALGGGDTLDGEGQSIPLEHAGSGLIMRVGLLATF